MIEEIHGEVLTYEPRDAFVRFGDTIVRIDSVVYVVLGLSTVIIALAQPSTLTGELIRLTLRDNDSTEAYAYFTDDRVARGDDD